MIIITNQNTIGDSVILSLAVVNGCVVKGDLFSKVDYGFVNDDMLFTSESISVGLRQASSMRSNLSQH
ncbi:MAG: hypothetical protein KDD50_03620 [Bdellovibrionales bacterium]|nr:hypothetical protein [Bdellovibrionales bacterium]